MSEDSRPTKAPRRRVTVTPPDQPDLASAMERNIRALTARQQEEEGRAGRETRIAEAVTRFTGSMVFVQIHLLLFGLWIAVNLGFLPFLPRFDPSFVILATWASVEAIFLSTFVLISQNRAAAAAERRANLDLQVSLLAEHEVTRLIRLTAAIASHLGIDAAHDPELPELQRDVAPEAVLDALDTEDNH